MKQVNCQSKLIPLTPHSIANRVAIAVSLNKVKRNTKNQMDSWIKPYNLQENIFLEAILLKIIDQIRTGKIYFFLELKGPLNYKKIVRLFIFYHQQSLQIFQKFNFLQKIGLPRHLQICKVSHFFAFKEKSNNQCLFNEVFNDKHVHNFQQIIKTSQQIIYSLKENLNFIQNFTKQKLVVNDQLFLFIKLYNKQKKFSLQMSTISDDQKLIINKLEEIYINAKKLQIYVIQNISNLSQQQKKKAFQQLESFNKEKRILQEQKQQFQGSINNKSIHSNSQNKSAQQNTINTPILKQYQEWQNKQLINQYIQSQNNSLQSPYTKNPSFQQQQNMNTLHNFYNEQNQSQIILQQNHQSLIKLLQIAPYQSTNIQNQKECIDDWNCQQIKDYFYTKNQQQIISNQFIYKNINQQQQDQVLQLINLFKKDPKKFSQQIQLQSTFVFQRQKKNDYPKKSQIQMYIRQLQAFHDDKLRILRYICTRNQQVYYIYKKYKSKYLINIEQVKNNYYHLNKINEIQVQQQKYILSLNFHEVKQRFPSASQDIIYLQLTSNIFRQFIETKWQNVIILNLSNINIGSYYFELLFNQICRTFPILQILDISNNGIQINNYQLNELNNHRNIRQANLIKNKIKINQINLSDILEKGIFSQFKYKIKQNHVQCQLVDGSKSNLTGQSLITKLQNTTIQLNNIISLNLSQNQLINQDLQIIIGNLHLFGKLKYIDFSKNKITNISQKTVIILQQYCYNHEINTIQYVLVINFQNNTLNKNSLHLLKQLQKNNFKFILSNQLDNQNSYKHTPQEFLSTNSLQNIRQNNYSIFISRLLLQSSILNQQNYNILNKWLQKPINKIQLIFKASKFGFDISKYFQICGDLKNTIIIAKTTKGKIIGGFTPLSFNPSQQLMKSEQEEVQKIKDESNSSFVFSISEQHKFQLNKDNIAISRNKDKIYIDFHYAFRLSDQSNTNRYGNYFLIDYNYYRNYDTSTYPKSKQSYFKVTGEKDQYFFTSQWQVYQVFF